MRPHGDQKQGFYHSNLSHIGRTKSGGERVRENGISWKAKNGARFPAAGIRGPPGFLTTLSLLFRRKNEAQTVKKRKPKKKVCWTQTGVILGQGPGLSRKLTLLVIKGASKAPVYGGCYGKGEMALMTACPINEGGNK